MDVFRVVLLRLRRQRLMCISVCCLFVVGCCFCFVFVVVFVCLFVFVFVFVVCVLLFVFVFVFVVCLLFVCCCCVVTVVYGKRPSVLEHVSRGLPVHTVSIILYIPSIQYRTVNAVL